MRNLKEGKEVLPKMTVYSLYRNIYCCTSNYNYNINTNRADANCLKGTVVLDVSPLTYMYDKGTYPYLELTLHIWSVSRRNPFFHCYLMSSVETNDRRCAVCGIDASDMEVSMPLVIGPDRKITLRKDADGDQFALSVTHIKPVDLNIIK